ncbi:MAG: pilus assembly protein [Anaerolineae bacterium]|nr:pilus assembly protein [Anaerolineae bacterium]
MKHTNIWPRGQSTAGPFGQRQQSEGQSLLEVALVLPILLLLVAIVVDTARAFDAYIVLTNAVREGARFATLESSPTIPAVKQLVVDDVLGSGTNVTHMADFSASDVAVDVGTSAITVTATYDFDLWFGGLVGVPTFSLEKTAVMPMYYPEP